MAKLTVAEASKRGYATGLSILQAVQKEWLVADKDADGQLLVDIADLEKIFGPAERNLQPTDVSTGRPIPAVSTSVVSSRPRRAAEDDAPAAPWEEAAGIAAADDNSETFTAGQEPGPGTGFAVTAPDEPEPGPQRIAEAMAAEADDRVALLTEIDRLRSELNDSRRHVAALLDVLSNRVLPLAQPSKDQPEKFQEDVAAPGHPQPTIFEQEEAAEVAINDDAANSDAAPSRDDNGKIAEPDDDIAVPALRKPVTVSGLTADDRPQFRQSSQTRPQTERTAPRRTGKSGTYFWQIWSLMSLVWVVMIGAFYWFIHDLPADLTATGQWIRGSLAGDAPAMVEASENLGLAARDILGPPALLLVVMLVAGALFRTLRRWSGDN